MSESVFKKIIPVDQAVGMVLPHDITEIVKDQRKGPAFRKGHIIRREDVDHLRRLGKDHIYVLELTEAEIHEDEAAHLMGTALAGSNVVCDEDIREGKMGLYAGCDGLLKVNKEALLQFNMLGEVMCSTLQTNTPVRQGEQIAATRLIPLVARRRLVRRAVSIAEATGPILEVLALRKVRAGLVITGSEVYYQRIEDRFEQVLRQKLEQLGSNVTVVGFAPDNQQHIAAEIHRCLAQGAEMVVTSGGMSVDPDDVTRLGIKEAGAEDIVYGTPVLPGAMFLVARIGEVPVIGVPACGMFHKITVLDLVLPRILAGETIGRRELAEMGHGGLCRNCETCRYPICNFGK